MVACSAGDDHRVCHCIFVFSLAYLYGGGFENGVKPPLEVTHFRSICWKEIVRL